MRLRIALVLFTLGFVVAAAALGQEPFEPLATPVPGSNVQIGTMLGVSAVGLGWEPDNGHLFAVALLGSTSWQVYLSTDGGASWSGEFTFGGSGIDDLSVAVAGGYLYVLYVDGGDSARLRRFSSSTGSADSSYGGPGFVNLIDWNGSKTIEEVAIAANPRDADDTIWCFVLTSDEAVYAYSGSAPDGTSFTAHGAVVTNAEGGLDAAWNVGYPTQSTEEISVFFSYLRTDGDILVYRRDETGTPSWLGSNVVSSEVSRAEETSISAFHDFIALAFEQSDGSGGVDAGYRTSSNGGAGWSVWPPLGVAALDGGDHYQPVVDVTSGSGLAVAMQRWSDTSNEFWFREQCNYGSAAWSSPVELTDHVPGVDDFRPPSDFEWLGGGWALAYVNGAGQAWFTWTPSIRYCGFECGSLGEWSSHVP